MGGRQTGGCGTRATSVHREITDEGIEVAPSMDARIAQARIEVIACERKIAAHEDRVIAVIRDVSVEASENVDARKIGERFVVTLRHDPAAPDAVVDVLQLQHAKRGLELAHLAVDA